MTDVKLTHALVTKDDIYYRRMVPYAKLRVVLFPSRGRKSEEYADAS